MIYTTSPIESYHRMMRKVTKTKAAFVSEDAIVKQIYLATINAQTKWTGTTFAWASIRRDLQDYFSNRFLTLTHLVKRYQSSFLSTKVQLDLQNLHSKSFLHFMNSISKILLLTFSLSLCSFSGTDYNAQIFGNYSAALYNKTNFQYYLVVRVHNLNTDEVREFCTLGVFFRQALHIEWKLDHDRLSEDLVLAKAYQNNPRLFEFKNPEALEYLNLKLYSINELNELSAAIDFKTLAKEIRAAKIWRKEFGDNEKLMRIYAHGLFNEGILTAEDITKGGTLEYVE